MRVDSTALLYQSPDASVQKNAVRSNVLSLYRFVLHDVLEAIWAYISRDFEAFDAHVGETLCQIRGYQILSLVNGRKLAKSDLQSKYEELETVYRKIEAEQPEQAQLPVNVSLKEFIKIVEIDFELDEDLCYLVKCYVLSKYKVSDEKGDLYLSHDNMVAEGNISKKNAKKLSHSYQASVAQSSTDYIAELVDGVPTLSKYKALLPFLTKKDDDGRTVLPCYFVMKVLFEHMFTQNHLLLFVVHRYQKKYLDTVFILFSPCAQDSKFKIVTDPSRALTSNPCYVVEGIVQYSKEKRVESQLQYFRRVIKHDIAELVMACMAEHPQLSGRSLFDYRENPYHDVVQQAVGEVQDAAKNLEDEFLTVKGGAYDLGCHSENKSLFHVTHIFCDTVYKQLDKFPRGLYVNQSLLFVNSIEDSTLPVDAAPIVHYNAL